MLRGKLIASACVAFAAATTVVGPAQACELVVVAPPRRGEKPPKPPPPLAPTPLPAGTTLVLASVSAATPYRIENSLDDQALLWEVALTLAPLEVGDLPQPEAVLWYTGQCGSDLLPYPTERPGQLLRLLLTRTADGRWVVESVLESEMFDAYLAGIRRPAGASD